MDAEKKFHASKFTKQWGKAKRKISVGTCAAEIQCEPIVTLNLHIVGTKTGPLTGLMCGKEQLTGDCTDGDEDERSDVLSIDDPDMLDDLPCNGDGGTINWNRPIQEANGESVTLYDFKPGTGEHYGDPIADVYAVIARANNAILAIADGSDWGPKAREAARSAVRGSIECLNKRLFDSQYPLKTTRDVMNAILLSFDSAHKCILETEGATSSALCVAVVCELVRPVRNKNWCVCVANLGDSACFVWSNRKGIAQEVTYGNSGKGCLGHAIGDKPDKSNLRCGFLPVHENDTVFLVTDGISENFDPVVLCEATASGKAGAEKRGSTDKGINAEHQPAAPIPEETDSAKLAKLTELLLSARSHKRVEYLNADILVNTLFEYAIQVTDEKRKFLERCWGDVDYIDAEDQSSKEDEILKVAEDYPGKVDHATAVAYKVGHLTDGQRHTIRKAFFYSPTV